MRFKRTRKIVDMIEKIDSVRHSDVTTSNTIQQPNNNAGSTNGISFPEKKITLQDKTFNDATSNLSESGRETLAQKQLNLQKAVEEINSELTAMQSEIGFSVDFETNKNIVTVTRKDSGEVVRQIPSETVLNVAHNIEKLKGVLFDKLI